jgi:hypothetical protein
MPWAGYAGEAKKQARVYCSELPAAYIGIILALGADSSLSAMPGIYDGIIRQHHQSGMDTIYELAATASRHHGGTDAVIKKRISGKYLIIGKKADTPGGMTRRMHY